MSRKAQRRAEARGPSGASGSATGTAKGPTGRPASTVRPGRPEQPPSAKPAAGPFRFLPYAIAALVCAALALRWFAAMGPATTHELASFCLPLKPDPGNPTLGTLPVAAPDVSATDINGETVKLSAYRGHVVVLNFWATWCPPCREETPGMLKLADALAGDKDVTVLGVANDKSWSDVSTFFRSIGVSHTAMTLMLDPEGAASHAFGTDKLPETYVLDPSGQVRYYFINTRDFGDPAAVRCIESLRQR